MAARDILLARRTGARVHLAHLSTRGSMELMRWARAQRIPVTAETAPHYFTLTDDLLQGFDAVYKMNPPLRESADVEAVRAALAEGFLDAIATDHAPHARDEKEREFEAAANGVIGLETSLGLSLKLWSDHGVPLSRVVATLTAGPAAALALPGGHLGVGAPADLVLVDLGAQWTVDPGKFFSKAVNCPFAGMRLKGRVVRTMVGGRTVYREGSVTARNLEDAEIL
jgi:dihydroorotase